MSHDHLRPELHVTVEQGICNAPAGVVSDQGSWHVFTQYRPTPQAGARWAHNIRPAGINTAWEMCDDVLAPVGDETDVRAGCALADGLVTRLYFTAVFGDRAEIHSATISDLAASGAQLSDDPGAVDPTVRREGRVVNERDEFTSLRSPWVVPDWRDSTHTNGLLMLCVAGAMSDPRIVLAHAPTDPTAFSIEGAMEFAGDPAIPPGRIVSPKLVRLRDEIDGQPSDVLLLTVENDNEPDISGYVVGTLSATTFHASRPFTRLDFGHDFTRPRATPVDSNSWVPAPREILLLGLLNSVSRGDAAGECLSFRTQGFANPLTLARLTTLEGGRLYSRPSASFVEQIRSSQHAFGLTALPRLHDGDAMEVTIVDATGTPQVVITHTGDSVMIDRSINPLYEHDLPAIAPLQRREDPSLTLLVDGATLEVYADSGAAALASRVESTARLVQAVVTTRGETAEVGEVFQWRPYEEEFIDDASIDAIDDRQFDPSVEASLSPENLR
ncbi:glycoside hydrolase family 32 protein [Corynebacterium choanae]|uniref:beta-fructofuranosidase n=1 Tax=Corynebacterium choanae TaxID=1862358 RepID=A0A3G6J8P0_9CORY|nr:glycoside hydrolase family 32 protein [Corynebacterium choanae]AZA13258.1 hypothetical protein CCHOA_04245 [Corynebacterium choanae]